MGESRTFYYLKSLNPEIETRYRQVELNLMLASLSYYDSLGNLLEMYLKYIALQKQIDIEKEDSHGRLMRKLSDYLLNEVQIAKGKFYAIKHLSWEINTHKHDHSLLMEKYKILHELKDFFDFYASISSKSIDSFSEFFDTEKYEMIYGSMSPQSTLRLFELLNQKLSSVNENSDKSNIEIRNYMDKILRFMATRI